MPAVDSVYCVQHLWLGIGLLPLHRIIGPDKTRGPSTFEGMYLWVFQKSNTARLL